MSTKYTKELLEEAVSNSLSGAGVLRYLGLKQAGGTQSHILKMIHRFEIDTSHWHRQAHNRGEVSPHRKTCEEILVILPKGSNRPRLTQLRRALGECGVEYKCVECRNTGEWMGKTITLEIDHISGDWLDNRLENLRFLCPNCHSQQPTNRGWKNKQVSKVAQTEHCENSTQEDKLTRG